MVLVPLDLSWLYKRIYKYGHLCKNIKYKYFTVFNFYDLSLWSCVVQSLCHIWLFLIPWIAACQSPLSSAIFQSLFKLMSTESVIPSKRFILCHPLLLLPSIFASIRVFSNKSALPIRWPDYWSFGFNIGPANEYSDLISFGIDWFDLLAIQRTLKSLLQHHGSKASVLQGSDFFTVQLSHPYMTTGKTIALTRLLDWTILFTLGISDF